MNFVDLAGQMANGKWQMALVWRGFVFDQSIFIFFFRNYRRACGLNV
jgi:hypothetical protein